MNILQRAGWVLPSLCVSLMLSLAPVQAKDAVADMWVFTPEKGKVAEFEAAFKAHVEERKKRGDPRQWKVYTKVTGEMNNTYYVRACCYEWAEFDKYRAWAEESKIVEHWMSNVAPLVGKMAHNMSEVDMDNSNWPEDDSAFKYFGVVTYHVKAGHGGETNEHLKKISDHAKKGNWPYNWSWSWPVDGGNNLSLVLPYENYAGMATPEVTFMDMLKEQMQSESRAKDLMEDWADNFESTSYTLYQLRDDLSMANE
ncbi:hypothetical protein [Ferrimonas marina]|uniref:NIPSNAP protein n=1 Tax=Ferrimonas marina TaxID=299255 RepID=A0A1M5MIU2_9GAMM|nr:hypothetical protein [Ferrimonas marina]SHG77121.1 hypothetical protein SAMN02745129_0658 [Ferrimonas marina]